MSTPAETLEALLRRQHPEQTDPPPFDPADTPAEPLPLFVTWFAEATEAGQPEPHTLSLATVDPENSPDVRTVTLRGADARGWRVAARSDSRKGHHLAATRRPPWASTGPPAPVRSASGARSSPPPPRSPAPTCTPAPPAPWRRP